MDLVIETDRQCQAGGKPGERVEGFSWAWIGSSTNVSSVNTKETEEQIFKFRLRTRERTYTRLVHSSWIEILISKTLHASSSK